MSPLTTRVLYGDIRQEEEGNELERIGDPTTVGVEVYWEEESKVTGENNNESEGR